MTINRAESVESARAIRFLLDENGKMVGQSAKWVIGGTKDRPAMQPHFGTTFNVVITGSKPFATKNLTAKVSFSRLILGYATGALKGFHFSSGAADCEDAAHDEVGGAKLPQSRLGQRPARREVR